MICVFCISEILLKILKWFFFVFFTALKIVVCKMVDFFFGHNVLFKDIDTAHDMYPCSYPLNSMWPYEPSVNIGSDNGLVPDGTKLLPGPMLTYHLL